MDRDSPSLFPPRERAPVGVDCSETDTFTDWCQIVSLRTLEGSPGALILGLRENEGYGGGFGAFDQTVVLFTRGDTVVPLATIRSGYYVMYAGERNRNGTRRHVLWDGALDLEWIGAGEAPLSVIVRPEGHAGRRRGVERVPTGL